MKVLGIAGSPRRGGNTDLLLAEVMRGAASKGAEVKTVVLSGFGIAPCQHCDACLKTGKCRVDDDMQMIYGEMEAADRIALASPMQFMGVTAETKAMIDRCQCLWARKYVLKLPPLCSEPGKKKGLFVSVGGTRFANLFDGARTMVKALFNTLDITYAGELLFRGIDEKGAITQYPDAICQAYIAGQKLVED